MRTSGRQRHVLPLLAVVFGGCALVSGALGRLTAEGLPGSLHGWIQLLFESAALLALEPPAGSSTIDPSTHNLAFSAARIAAVLFVFLGAASVLVELYRPARDAWLHVRFWWARHRGRAPAVVIGLGPVGSALVRELRSAQRRPVYAIHEDGRPADDARRADALVIAGNAADRHVREHLDLRHASEVFIATHDDARDVDIAGSVLQDVRGMRLGRRSTPLRCYVHASTPSLAGALGSHRLLHDSRREVAFEFFNLHEQAARDLLLDESSGLARLYAPDDVAHYIVLGFGEMGQTVALQMARLAHFRSSRRLRLTVVNDPGEGKGSNVSRDFLGRHPGFAPDAASFDMLAHRRLNLPGKDDWGCRYWRPADPAWRSDVDKAVEYAVNAEFLDAEGAAEGTRLLNVLLDRIRPAAADALAGVTVRPALVICFDTEAQTLRCALWLREALEVARLDGLLTEPIPAYVYRPTDRGLARLLEASPEFEHSAAIRLHVFGAVPSGDLYGRIVRPEIRRLAARIHDAYRQQTGGPAFDALPPVLQASNVDAAAHAVLKKDALERARRATPDPARSRSSGLDEAEIEMLARMEHNRWMAERLVSGFRMGEKKVVRAGPVEHENRRRPSLLPWEQLSQRHKSETMKDIRQVLAVMKIAGPA